MTIPPQHFPVHYHPKKGLAWLCIRNALLNIITLSIYRFWAKTHVRRHIWSCIHIDNEPLEYTGTGKELFLGFLVVVFVLILPIVALETAIQLIYGPQSAIGIASQFLLFIAIFILYGAAVYRAQRYRLSRTLWRGIRSTLDGSSISFTLLYMGSFILRIVSLGWLAPAMNLAIRKRLFGDMRFGNEAFRFAGGAAPLYKRFAICWFMALAIFGFSFGFIAVVSWAVSTGALEIDALKDYFDSKTTTQQGLIAVAAVVLIYLLFGLVSAVIWSAYQAKELAVFAQYTSLDNLRFSLNATTLSLLKLIIGNLLIIVFTLGIGAPFVTQRNARYICDRLTASGELDYQRIAQSTATQPRVAEGLVDAFDIDTF